MENKTVSAEFLRLIYNPDLPEKGRDLPPEDKWAFFHKIFLLLNEDFQMQWGKVLEEKYNGAPSLCRHSCVEQICRKSKTQYCKMIFPPDEFIEILKYDKVRLSEWTELAPEGNQSVKHQGGKYQGTIRAKSIRDTCRSLRTMLPAEIFIEYIAARKRGEIPSVLYPAVIIERSKTELMKDFEKYVDEMQKALFEQKPELQRPERGHFPKKVDKRTKPRKFDAWSRAFRTYVLIKNGMKQVEVAKQMYKQNRKDEVYGIQTVSLDKKRAERLIKMAWDGQFPGDD